MTLCAEVWRSAGCRGVTEGVVWSDGVVQSDGVMWYGVVRRVTEGAGVAGGEQAG